MGIKKKVKTTYDKVDNAVLKSFNAIDVFTSTIEQLRQANDELASAREEDLQRINEIQSNVSRADEMEKKNNNLISKINSIIG